MNKEITASEIDMIMQKAWSAFHVYRKMSLKRRAEFMRAIAVEFDALGDETLKLANEETSLPDARLRNEKARTIFQLNSYADACERGEWLEARIDMANPDRTPPKPDLRKMLVPLGPVVVYGASNFPFAFSTAGGDTASALAAGCPVIVKAHHAHIKTSTLVAIAVMKAAKKTNMPEGIFAHVETNSREIGKALIQHPHTKAVGFTGSFTGGTALWNWANQRKEPIPVFAEMGSINPVFLLPEKLKTSASEIAAMYAGSITLSVGQFCTNPGLIIGIESEELKTFIHDLGKAIQQVAPAPMLHSGILQSYKENKATALLQEEVHLVAESAIEVKENDGLPTVATATGEAYLNNPVLHHEVFGPYSIVIRCKDMEEMITVAKHTEGQLTSTLMATENDIRNNDGLVEAVKNICGRFIVNGVPTGVEVCLSMHHGGPFPATTDSRFTSVGADAIKRFARPLSFQNWPNGLLPDELKDENPLGIWRTINNELRKV
jgi:NADP-dependent aldehyde dehydrogenase